MGMGFLSSIQRVEAARNGVELCLSVVEMAAIVGDGDPAAGCPQGTVGTHIRPELAQ